MRGNAGSAGCLRVLPEHLPDDLLAQPIARHTVGPVDRPKYVAIRYTRWGSPSVDRHLHPGGHGHRADAAVFADHIDDAPAIIALLHVRVREGCHLRPTQTAAEENGEDGAIPQSLHRTEFRPVDPTQRLSERKPVPEPDAH